MYRPTVRIDVLNGAEGAVIKSLQIRNALTEAPVYGGETSGTEELSFTDFSESVSPDSPEIRTGVCRLFPYPGTEMTVTVEFEGSQKTFTWTMEESEIQADMIWGISVNVDKELEIKEIKAGMNEGYIPEFTIPATEYLVGAALKGAADASPSPLFVIQPYDYEQTVESAHFVFFRDGILKHVSKGEKYGLTQFQASVYESGNYGVTVIANASEELGAALEALPEGSTREEFESVVATQAPDAENMFLMRSEMAYITVENSWTYISRLDMERLSSRIDIINGVPGMLIDKIVFGNRAIMSPLVEGDLQGEWTEDTEYPGIDGTGDTKDYPMCTGKIYSYSNTSGDRQPKITIYCTIDGTKTERTVDFSSVGGIRNNKLYSLVLSGPGAEAVLSEQNWDTGYTPEIGDIQEEMNEALAIRRFAEYNVKAIDGRNVTFCSTNNSAAPDSEDASAFFKFKDGWDEGIYTDSKGYKYRVPDEDEMQLLFPREAGALNFYSSAVLKEFTETLPETIFGVYGGGSGESVFRNMKFKNEINGYVCYAIRFKGTEQYSAYRYEHINPDPENESDEAYISIKVKALSPDDNPDIVNISDAISPEYWESGYVEYRIPLCGALLEGETKPSMRGYISNLWYNAQEPSGIFVSYRNMGSVYMKFGTNDSANLRLVRVD